MILGIDQGIGGCVLDMEKKMGWVPRLETAENNEFLKSVKFFGLFWGPKMARKPCFSKSPGPRTSSNLFAIADLSEKEFSNSSGDLLGPEF